MPERTRGSRRARLATLSIVTALLVGAYLALPSGDEGLAEEAAAGASDAGEPHKLGDCQRVARGDAAGHDGVSSATAALTTPPSSAPSRARRRSKWWRAGPGRWSPACRPTWPTDARSCASPTATSAASRMTCASRPRTGASRSAGSSAASRCSPSASPSWRAGIRETVGIGSARRLASLARNTPAALGFGTVAGALVQSTTAAAGLLAGLVTSSVIAVGPAAVAFLGAQLGAATAPLRSPGSSIRARACWRSPSGSCGWAWRRIGGRRRSVDSCWAPA